MVYTVGKLYVYRHVGSSMRKRSAALFFTRYVSVYTVTMRAVHGCIYVGVANYNEVNVMSPASFQDCL